MVEQHREDGFRLNQAVLITILGEKEFSLEARLVELSASEVRLHLEQALAVSALIRVEWDSSLLLGEVIICIQDGEKFRVDVKLEHAFTQSADLSALIQSFLDASEASEAPNAVKDRR